MPPATSRQIFTALRGRRTPALAGRHDIRTDGDGNAVGVFSYDRAYLELDGAREIDPVNLPLSDDPKETDRTDGLFGAFGDALPDAWGRILRETLTGQSLPPTADFMLLVPGDGIGALAFGPPGADAPRPTALPSITDLDTLLTASLEVSRAAREGRQPPGDPADHRKTLDLAATSIGGSRPKSVVTDGTDVWIAKFPGATDHWNNARVEHAVMALARLCGIETAETRLATAAGRDFLLVKRFDRGEGGERRLPMLSAMTLLGADETRDETWSYPLLADRLAAISTAPDADREQLFRRMAFNALVSNADDHPRNHAVFDDGGGWRLTPAYDLVPVPQLAISRRDLAMTVGRYGRAANRTNILSTAHAFGLEGDRAAGIVSDIEAAVSASWLPACREAGVTPGDCDTISGAFNFEGYHYDLAVDN